MLLCTGVSLLLGVLIALIYMRQARYTKSFAVTLALLPAMVEIVILLVNGNLGTGVAVAGAFGLVRFRSLPGSAGRSAASFSPWPSALPPAWAIWDMPSYFFF